MVFFGALMIRLIHFSLSVDNPLLYMPILDESYYINLGKTIANGYWLGESRAFFMDPLYGYVLSVIFFAFGDNLTSVRLLQIILDSINVMLLYMIGARVWSRPAGMMSAIFYATYKVAFFYTLLILKTTMATTVLLFFTLILIGIAGRKRARLWYVLGALLGLVTYLRANFILIGPILIVSIPIFEHSGWRESLNKGALLFLGLLTLISIGALRNYMVTHEFILLNTQSGRLLYASNNPENLTGHYNIPAFSRPDPEGSNHDFHREAERRLGWDLGAKEVSWYWTGETLRVLKENPGIIPVILYNKLKGTIGNYEIPNNHSFYLASQFSPLMGWPLPNYAFALSFGVPGLILGLLRNRSVVWILIPVVTIFFTLMIFYTSSRFRMPAIPFLLLGAGIFISIISGWIREGKTRNIIISFVVVSTIGVLSFIVPVPDGSGTEEFFLSKAYWKQQELEKARTIASKGVDTFPFQARFQLLLGMISSSSNHPEESILHFHKALKLEPKNVDAHHNLGLVYITVGKPEIAINYILKGLSMESRPRFYFSLAKAYEATGDGSLASEYYIKYLKTSGLASPFRGQAENALTKIKGISSIIDP